MKKYIIYILLLSIIIISCKQKNSYASTESTTDTIPMIIMQIQKCSRLYTTEYHIHKIVTHDDHKKLTGTFLKNDFSIDLPLGKRKIAIPMDVTLKAYIDFNGFSESNIKHRGSRIEIVLPDPKVMLTSSRINHNDIKQYIAFTRSNFSDEELTNYEHQGRQAIINDIPKMDIIETARESAARILIPILSRIGYKEKDITITFRKQFTIKDIPTLFDKSTIENEKANQ